MPAPVILVIDDTDLARESMARLLQFEGFQTLTAPNGKEAYAMLYSNTPQLVLLDLRMPEMDGLTFLRMVRNSPRWGRLPVIVVTGVDEGDIMVNRARELGVDDLVPKGNADFKDLLARVKRIMAEHPKATAASA